MQNNELIFQAGLIVNEEIFDYKRMEESAKNWLYLTKYQFSENPFHGYIDCIQLMNLQLGHKKHHEGVLFEGYTPQDCVTIAVVQENFGKLCINNQKMSLHDIIIMDDTKPYDFISSARTKIGVISIKKSVLLEKTPDILSMGNMVLKDVNNTLSKTIEKEWAIVLQYERISKDQAKLDSMEKRLIDVLLKMFKGNAVNINPLTENEKKSIEMKHSLLDSLKNNISIGEASKKLNITEKTYQKSFESLYGMTPKYFVEMIKLNNENEDSESSNSKTVVLEDFLKVIKTFLVSCLLKRSKKRR